MLRKLAFRDFFHESFKSIIGMKIFTSRTVIKIYCRLFSKYFAIKEEVGDVVESLELVAKIRAECLSSSSISLCINKCVQDVKTIKVNIKDNTKNATEA